MRGYAAVRESPGLLALGDEAAEGGVHHSTHESEGGVERSVRVATHFKLVGDPGGVHLLLVLCHLHCTHITHITHTSGNTPL